MVVAAPGNTLFGVKPGPKGLLKGNLFEITDADVDTIINTDGYDFLGTDRTKIKTDEQFQQVKDTCVKHNLDAIVVIGGDGSTLTPLCSPSSCSRASRPTVRAYK